LTSDASQHLSRALLPEEEQRALALHKDAFVVDPVGGFEPMGPSNSLDPSIEKMRAGGVDSIGLTLSSEIHDFKTACDHISWWNKLLRRHERDVVMVQSAEEFLQAREDGRIAVFYIFQSGKPFEDELGYIELFRQMGVTSSQITYDRRNYLGDGHLESTNAGLSMLGKDVVAEMNRVGMLVDLSHAGESTQQDILRASTRPVWGSHLNAYSVNPVARNATNETLDLLKANGGVSNAMGLYVSPDLEPTIAQVGDHLEFLASYLGEEFVGVTTDCKKSRDLVHRHAYLDDEGYLNVMYEGSLKMQRYHWPREGHLQEYPWWYYPLGWRQYDEYLNITREMVARGMSDEFIRGALGGNFLRLFRDVVG
jgi:membrane dipeptidase